MTTEFGLCYLRFACIHKPIYSSETNPRFSIIKIKSLSWTAEAPSHRISLSICTVLLVLVERTLQWQSPNVVLSLILTDLPLLSPTSHHHSHQKFSLKHLTCFGQHVLSFPYLGWQAWPNKNKAKTKILVAAWIRMKSYNFLVSMENQVLKSSHRVTRAWIIWKNQLKTSESFLLTFTEIHYTHHLKII